MKDVETNRNNDAAKHFTLVCAKVKKNTSMTTYLEWSHFGNRVNKCSQGQSVTEEECLDIGLKLMPNIIHTQ